MKIVLIFTTSILLISCAGIKNNPITRDFASNPVIAHRGAFKKNNLPENSIAALKEAIRLQCTGSEFDVRMTLDDSLIVNHDPHYHNMEIEKTAFGELSKIKLENGETLPTLRSYLLEGIKQNKTRLVLEIKPSSSKERGQLIAARVVQMVKDLDAVRMVEYISFDYDILKKVKELDPGAIVQYLKGDITPEQLVSDKIDGLDYHITVYKANPSWIASAKSKGLILNVWTVNNEADMKWLLSQGVHFITTNEPELLLQVVKQK